MKTILAPDQCAQAVVQMGIKKAKTKASKVFVLGFAAGVFVGLAYVAYLTATSIQGMNYNPVIAKFIGALLFPTAIILALLVGGSLFTGNALMTLAWFTRDIKFKDIMQNWLFVWLGNFAGALFLVFVCYYAETFTSEAMFNAIIDLATHKTHLSFTAALFSGFLCNVLVGIGVWGTFAATDVQGKIIITWFPIAMFAFCGFQHVVANMFVISMAWVLQPSAFTLAHAFLNNFIPVTLGNALGGGAFLTGIYYFLYLRKDKTE